MEGSLKFNQKLLIGVSALIQIIVLIWLIPLIGSIFLKHQININNTFYYRTEMIGGGDIMVPLLEEENPIVYIDIPKFIKISETKPVRAELEEIIKSIGLQQGHKYSNLNYAASLSSPSFNISPSSDPIAKSNIKKLSWEWLVNPKSTGKHALRLEFSSPVISEESINKIVSSSETESLEISQNSVVAFVTVLDTLGLTARQSAILKALGAIIGVIGTIFG